MKKIFKKSNIFSFLLGAIIFGGIVGVSAYTILATDIGYTPKDATWKKSNGEDITNVNDAINELYAQAKSGFNITSDNLLIEQSNTIDGTVSKTYTAEKKEIIVVSLSQTGNEKHSNNITTTGSILKDSNNLSKDYNSSWYINIRTVVVELDKDDTLTISSTGTGYGSGQYSMTYIK